MERRIHGLTSAQSNRASEAALLLTREWLLAHGVGGGKYGAAAAMADLSLDCYVASVKVDYTTPDGRAVRGRLVWLLDNTFEATGEPEVRHEPAS